MKALTLQQPWAWAILNAGKDIENRSRHTKVRGVVAIHAGVQLDRSAHLPEGVKDELVYGAIVGVVDITDSVDDSASKWFNGPVGYVLRNPRELPNPVPCKGQLGFWNVPPEIVEEINRQLRSGEDYDRPASQNSGIEEPDFSDEDIQIMMEIGEESAAENRIAKQLEAPEGLAETEASHSEDTILPKQQSGSSTETQPKVSSATREVKPSYVPQPLWDAYKRAERNNDQEQIVGWSKILKKEYGYEAGKEPKTVPLALLKLHQNAQTSRDKKQEVLFCNALRKYGFDPDANKSSKKTSDFRASGDSRKG